MTDNTVYEVIDRVDTSTGGPTSSFYEKTAATETTAASTPPDTAYTVVDRVDTLAGSPTSSFYEKGTVYEDLVLSDSLLVQTTAQATAAAASAAAAATSASSFALYALQTYVDAADALKAPLASPGLSGTPTAPTAAPGTNTTQLATTAYVLANGTVLGSATPVMDGTGAAGVGTVASRQDHVHPGQLFDTRAAVIAASVGTTVTYIRTQGYATTGDAGGSLYKRGVGQGQITTADAQVFSIVPENGRFNVRQFGAVGDGATDDLTAFNNTKTACVSSTVAFYMPAGTYSISGSFDITGLTNIYGDGAATTVVITTANVAMMAWNCDTTQLYYGSFHDFCLIGNVSGTRTSNFGISITGTTAGKPVSYTKFYNLLFLGVYAGINYNKLLVGTAGEAQTDWNSYANLKTTNYGANQVAYGIRCVSGSGTGNTYSGNTLVTSVAGIYFDSNTTMNVGDIIITGNQFGGSGVGVYAHASPGVYGANIALTANQWDAGIVNSIDFANISNFRMSANNFGGDTSRVLSGCSGYYIEGAGGNDSPVQTVGSAAPDYMIRASLQPAGGNIVQEERLLNSKSNVAASSALEMFRINMPNTFTACVVDIMSSGLQQGLGCGFANTRWYLIKHGAGITATLVSDQNNAWLTHSIDVTNVGYAKIKLTTTSTLADNIFTASCQVVGQQSYIQRM